MKQLEGFLPYKRHNIFIRQSVCETSQAHMLIIHGLGEHSGSYNEMALQLNKKNISCYGFDLIGHGKSSGQRGYIPSLEEFASLSQHVSKHICQDFSIDKLHVFSHSMGGLIHLLHLQKQNFYNQVSAIFSNPLLGLNMKPPEWKIGLAKNLAHVLPRLALFNEIKEEDLSHDPSMPDVYLSDSLRHTKISTRLYTEILEQSQKLQAEGPKFKLPGLVLLSPSDKICDSEKTQDFFTGYDKAHVEVFPQSAHEIVNDMSKQRAFDIISNFVLGELS